MIDSVTVWAISIGIVIIYVGFEFSRWLVSKVDNDD